MTFGELIDQIEENSAYGYETTVIGENKKVVTCGSLISREFELPDKPERCHLVINDSHFGEGMCLI